MKLGLHQSARMEQRLVQSPQMIQAMQILQLAGLDLVDRIEQELIENPFLETQEGSDGGADGEGGDGGEGGAGASKADEPGTGEMSGVENMLEVLERYERDFGDGSRRAIYDDHGDRKLEAMRNTPDAPKTVAEALIEQLAMIELDERGRSQAEYLVWSLDHRGWLDTPLAELAETCDVPDTSEDELEDVLYALRRAIHPALGAADLRECLLLQLEASELDAPLVRTLVEDHIEDITTNRLPRIAKATGRTIEEIKHGLEAIRALDPYPGWEYGGTEATAIVPDVVVAERDGELEIRMVRQRIPELGINPSYKKFLKEAVEGDGVQEWVKKRIESARWFIDAIAQRQSTLERISTRIFEHQKAFLSEGIKALVPMRMQEVADEVGVHISTVSRAVSGKYAETPRGIYPLKFFFTGGTKKETGGVASQTAIKQRIRELVEAEDPTSPLSDDQIAAQLEERDSIKIARRTVTKYRKALSIPSSGQRRKF